MISRKIELFELFVVALLTHKNLNALYYFLFIQAQQILVHLILFFITLFFHTVFGTVDKVTIPAMGKRIMIL